MSFHDTVDEIDFDPGIAGPGESTTNDESVTGDEGGGWWFNSERETVSNRNAAKWLKSERDRKTG